MGTMAYMAPEQVQSKRIDTTTDVWSLGALFYEMLSGRKAFDEDHIQAVMYMIVNLDPEPIPDLPPELTSILQKALQKNPRLRHKDAGEFLADLSRGHEDGEEGKEKSKEKKGRDAETANIIL